MAKFFALVAGSGDTLNIFDGATGSLVSSHSLPDNLAFHNYVDMSYDGTMVAVTSWNFGYVWFLNQATNATSQVPYAGFIGQGHGFDGTGVFYLGGGDQQYIKIAAPYTSSTVISTPGQALAVYPNQVPAKSAARVRDPATGNQSFVKLNLATGVIGDPIGFDAGSSTPIMVDNACKYALTGFQSSDGVRIWDYTTLEYAGQIGPVSSFASGRAGRRAVFSSDGTQFVIKTGDNFISVGALGGAFGARQVSLDAVLEYAADNTGTVVEGMLDDDHVLLSSTVISNMLVSFNIVTASVDWQTSSGRSFGVQAQDWAYCGVQPTLGPGDGPPVPPDPPDVNAFWTQIVQAHETVS